MDIRDYYPAEQHDFVEFSRQETVASFAATAVSVLAQAGHSDPMKLINILGTLTFPGSSDLKDKKSAEIAQQLKEVTAKSYNMYVVGGKGVLDIQNNQNNG